MTVRIHIDRLVLDGFALTAGQGRQVQAAVERELSRLVANAGVSNGRDENATSPPQNESALAALMQSGGSVPSASAGGFHPPPNAKPAQLGRHIARSVYGGMEKAK
jgi:hypothetical protein